MGAWLVVAECYIVSYGGVVSSGRVGYIVGYGGVVSSGQPKIRVSVYVLLLLSVVCDL